MSKEKHQTEFPTSLKPGQIRFYDNSLPGLEAGSYSVRVSQTIEGDHDKLGTKTFGHNQDFIVQGPRFVLPEGEVHSIYPPPNVQANYEGVLPQVIFRKRSLPWERKISSENHEFPCPWIALMLFEPDELLVSEEENNNMLHTRAVSRMTAEMFPPDKLPKEEQSKALPENYLPPAIKPNAHTDEKNCYTIDLDKQTFFDLAPHLSELPYLAHVREVNTDEKEFLGMHAEGWFSVVLGNRLPKTPPEIQKNSQEEVEGKNFVRNIVHLVSLEGFTQYLAQDNGIKNTDSSFQRVRLASLMSWEFYCKPPSESFEQQMNQLSVDMLKVQNTDDIQNLTVKNALEGGYIPLQYHTRMGEHTMAWYRGPLQPVIKREHAVEDTTFFSAEAGLIFDEENGMFDCSYAVAWQIARLMALSDLHFATSLLTWKRTAVQKIKEYLYRSKGDEQKIEESLDPDFPRTSFFKHFMEPFAHAKGQFDKSRNPKAYVYEKLADYPGIISPDIQTKLKDLGKELPEGLIDQLFPKQNGS